MRKRTLQQVIDAAKSGKAVDPDECREAMLALHSMYTKLYMEMEIIADAMEKYTSLYITRGYVRSPEVLQEERNKWMNTIPSEYLKENKFQITRKQNDIERIDSRMEK